MSLPIYLVDGVRTPFRMDFSTGGGFSATDLLLSVWRQLLIRQGIDAGDVDTAAIEYMPQWVNERNPLSAVALRLGLNSLQYCGISQGYSGGQAFLNTLFGFQSQHVHCALVGGVLLSPWPSSDWVRHVSENLDIQMTSTLTLEYMAGQVGISREEQDHWTQASHVSASLFDQSQGWLSERLILVDRLGNQYRYDSGICTELGVSAVPPIVQQDAATITTLNSASICEGSVGMLLADEVMVRRYHWQPLARIVDWSVLSEREGGQGLGGVEVVDRVLRQQNLSGSDIAWWEWHETSAAQVLACLVAGRKRAHLMFSDEMKKERVNVRGGALALGDCMSVLRLLLHLSRQLRSLGGRYGMVVCPMFSGQAMAILLESM